jgi:hypothetical protein
VAADSVDAPLEPAKATPSFLAGVWETLKRWQQRFTVMVAVASAFAAGASTLVEYAKSTIRFLHDGQAAEAEAITEFNKRLGQMRLNCMGSWRGIEALVDVPVTDPEKNRKTSCSQSYLSARDQAFILGSKLKKPYFLSDEEWTKQFSGLYDAISEVGINGFQPKQIDCAWSAILKQTSYSSTAFGSKCGI